MYRPYQGCIITDDGKHVWIRKAKKGKVHLQIDSEETILLKQDVEAIIEDLQKCINKRM